MDYYYCYCYCYHHYYHSYPCYYCDYYCSCNYTIDGHLRVKFRLGFRSGFSATESSAQIVPYLAGDLLQSDYSGIIPQLYERPTRFRVVFVASPCLHRKATSAHSRRLSGSERQLNFQWLVVGPRFSGFGTFCSRSCKGTPYILKDRFYIIMKEILT